MVSSLIKTKSFIFPDDSSICAMEIDRGVDEIDAEILS